MNQKIGEWDGIPAVRIPDDLADASGFVAGTKVTFRKVGDGLLITPKTVRRKKAELTDKRKRKPPQG